MNDTTSQHLHILSRYYEHAFYAVYLYPLSYLNPLKPKSLVRISCAKIVKSDEFRKHNAQYSIQLPIHLYPIILTDALRLNCLDCAEFLLSTWPSKVMSMSEVIPFVRDFSSHWLSAAHGAAETVLLRLFWLGLYVLRKGLTPILRVIDLRGALLSCTMVNLLIREIFCLCNGNEPLLDDYHIVIDCEVEKYTYDELMVLLATTENKSRKIHLHINKLRFGHDMSETQTSDMLKRINPNELTGLAMTYFSNDFLTSILTRFSSLTSLRLSSTPNEILPLNLLPRLRRLDLDYNHSFIADCVPLSTLSELEYLYVGKCPKDFQHLIAVPLRLREINFSCEVVEPYLQLWRDLLLSLAPTLKVLEIELGIEDPNYFPSIVSFILPLVNLVYLNLSGNAMTFSAMLEHVPKLSAMPNLKRMLLNLNEVEMQIYDEIERKRWLEAIAQKSASAKAIPVEIVVLVY